MLHDIRKLETALFPLLQRPLWKSHRAVDLQIFHFGAKRTVMNNFGPRKGEQSEVGEYCLQIQCAWRIRGPRGIVVASKDRSYRPAPMPVPDNDDWDWSAPGANRCDARVREWLEGSSYMAEQVTADKTGGIVLSISDGYFLEVFPDSSLDGEYSEFWRLLRPGELSSHFVVSGSGIDE